MNLKHVEEQFNFKKILTEILVTIIGALIMAIGVAQFLLPNQLSSGGITGAATIMYYLFGLYRKWQTKEKRIIV